MELAWAILATIGPWFLAGAMVLGGVMIFAKLIYNFVVPQKREIYVERK